jgi:hypothetical protein
MKLSVSQIYNNVGHINNFIKIHRKYMTDDDIYNICVKLCDELTDTNINLMTLLSQFLHFEPHIISKLFHYQLKTKKRNNLYNINNIYGAFPNIIKCTNKNVTQFIDKLNKNILICGGTLATLNALKHINKIIKKINTYEIYEIALNSIMFFNLSDYAT